MNLKIRIAVWALAALFVTSTTLSFADEVRIPRRIALQQPLDHGEDMRVMLVTSTDGLLPGHYHDTVLPLLVNTFTGALGWYVAAGIILTVANTKVSNENGASKKVELQNRLVPVLKDSNISEQFEHHIMDAFQRAAFERIAIEHPEDATDLEQPGLLSRITERNVITVSVQCFFDEDGRRFNSITDVYVWKKNQTVPIYFTQLFYSSPTIASAIGSEPFDYWLKDNGKALLSQFPIAAQETASMLHMDLLSSSPTPLAATPKDTVWTNFATATRSNVPLFVLQSNQERLIGRPYAPETAILVSLPSDPNATLQ